MIICIKKSYDITRISAINYENVLAVSLTFFEEEEEDNREGYIWYMFLKYFQKGQTFVEMLR